MRESSVAILARQPGRHAQNISDEERLICDSIDETIVRLLDHHRPEKKKKRKKQHGPTQRTALSGIEKCMDVKHLPDPDRIFTVSIDAHEHPQLKPFLEDVPGFQFCQQWPADIQYHVYIPAEHKVGERLLYRAIERKAKHDYEKGHTDGRIETQDEGMEEHPMPHCRFVYLIETGTWHQSYIAAHQKGMPFGLSDLMVSAYGKGVFCGFDVQITRSSLETVFSIITRLCADLTYKHSYLDHLEKKENPCLTSAPWDSGRFEYCLAKQEFHSKAPGLRCDNPRSWWIKALAITHGMGEENALAIARAYPSAPLLTAAYQDLDTIGKKEALLQSVESTNSKGVIQSLSATVYRNTQGIGVNANAENNQTHHKTSVKAKGSSKRRQAYEENSQQPKRSRKKSTK